jgi:uncharacterized membrane protein YeaQ/YmgE (transglycosylase-associated protein family)
VLAVGGLAGAIAGRQGTDLLLSADQGVWFAVLAGAVGALVAGLVIAGAAWLGDRESLRGLDGLGGSD